MSLSRQVIRFGCVGVAAMAVHLAVISALVPLGMTPLLANVAAFAVAFQVSYFGHKGWTFAAAEARGGYLRMLAVSLVSFALNEAMFAGLLRAAWFDYRIAQALVLIAVAAFTFVASRFWVFSSPRDPA